MRRGSFAVLRASAARTSVNPLQLQDTRLLDSNARSQSQPRAIYCGGTFSSQPRFTTVAAEDPDTPPDEPTKRSWLRYLVAVGLVGIGTSAALAVRRHARAASSSRTPLDDPLDSFLTNSNASASTTSARYRNDHYADRADQCQRHLDALLTSPNPSNTQITLLKVKIAVYEFLSQRPIGHSEPSKSREETETEEYPEDFQAFLMEKRRRDPNHRVFELAQKLSQSGEREEEEGELLPAKLRYPYGKPLTLVVDLSVLLARQYSKSHGWRYVKRPGLDYFLYSVSQIYEVVVMVPAQRGNMEMLMTGLDPQRLMEHKVFRDAYVYDVALETFVKPLNRINRDPETLVILHDDGPKDAWKRAIPDELQDNVIHLHHWNGLETINSASNLASNSTFDEDLLDVLPLLEAFHSSKVRDVRTILAQYRESGNYVPSLYRPRRMAIAQAADTQRRKAAGTGGMFSR